MDSFITVSGNLTRDPEVRFSDSGTAGARLSLAVNRKDKAGNETTTFYDVVVFGQMGSNVADSLTKGNRVVVTGRLEVRNFQRNDGTEGKAVEIIASEIGASFRFNRLQVVEGARGGNRQHEDSLSAPF